MALSKEQRNKKMLQRIGKGVKFWRKDKGLNQEELSKLMAVSRSYIAKVETAGTGISFNKVDEFAIVFNLRSSTLTMGSPDNGMLNIIKGLKNKYELEHGHYEKLYRLCRAGDVKHRDDALDYLNKIK